MKIEMNKVFTIEKGNGKLRWKVVEHPYFDRLALVRDHLYLKSGKCTREDMNHIMYGGNDLKEAYEIAYDHS